MGLSVTVTLVFACVVFYAGLLLYLGRPRRERDTGSTSGRGPGGGEEKLRA